LGETDEAITELQRVVDSGWLSGWWILKSGEFDPNYAAVTADPRFVALNQGIEQHVAELRANYLENPELPPEQARLINQP
jgi:hypothetical protein